MRLPISLCLVAVLGIPSAAAYSESAELSAPFDFSHREIGLVVTARNRSLYVLIDTGVNPSVIDLKVAEQLGLPLQRRQAGKAGGEGPGQAAAIPSVIEGIKIGKKSFGNVEALAVDLGGMSADYGHPLDAILGFSFLNGKKVLIDYPNRTATFYSGNNGPDLLKSCSVSYTIPFVSLGEEEFPVIREFRFGNTKVPATLDTGSSRNIGLYRSALKLPGIRNALRLGQTTQGASFGGSYATTTATFNVPVGIGPFELPSGQTVSIMPAEGSARNRMANVGNGFFAAIKARLFLDYVDRRISLFGQCRS